MTKLTNGRDQYGNDIGLREPSDYIDGFALAASTSERIALPSGYSRVVLSATANIAVKFGDSSITAAIPSDTTDGTGSELNPSGYKLDVISSSWTHMAIISDATCKVSLAWYKS